MNFRPQMLKLLGTKTLTIDEMVAAGFCIEMGIFKHVLRTRCTAMVNEGLFEVVKVYRGNVISPHGVRHQAWRNAYKVKSCQMNTNEDTQRPKS